VVGESGLVVAQLLVEVPDLDDLPTSIFLIIGFCILLHVMLTVNNNTFCFATIDEVFYYVASVLTTCFGPYIRPSSGEFTKY
jgi:hypothetical protein